MTSPFIHLHCHSEYSLLEGAMRIRELLNQCEIYKMPALALTDNGCMYGVIDFYVQARARGIKPIIGCEIYLTADINQKVRGWDRLILLCKDYSGYQNLIKLVTISHLEGFYYKPRLDIAHLSNYSQGLIAISPGRNGPVGYNINSNKLDDARVAAARLKEIYSSDFYLGIQKLGIPMEELTNESTLEIAKDLDIPVVATNDVYYVDSDSAFLKDILYCIRMGKLIENETRLSADSRDRYFRNPDEMQDLFSDLPEAIENTVKIAEMCNLEIDTEQVRLPNFSCPDNQTPEQYLNELVWKGISRKYTESNDDIKNRVEFELSIINKMYYAPYFLIIYDFLEFARSQHIPIGPGRGSAAGSIVAYALDITQIDPLKYNLLFERFLNPDRVSMPDIDLDFCIRRRSEVIDYIVKHYGTDHVSQIVTFGSMAARGVIRDVGRVLNVPLNEVDQIAKLIPSSPGAYTSIPDALKQVKELKKLYNATEEHKQLLDIGSRLEGFVRHTSTHAAGIVISRDPLSDVVPLTKNEGQVVTQFQMTDLEKVGLLKMDILGLRNLTVIEDTLRLIKENKGETVSLEHIPFTDTQAYDLLCSGNTIGIFQLESRGMRQLIKDLQPRVFEDIIALLALYRPGPLGSGMVNEFISNKSGKTTVKYEVPELEPILQSTYGMIVYQEQVMQIASAIGGFSLGEADMLRRAMGKKKKSVMAKMKDQFIAGAKEKKIPVKKAEKIFELCYKFAEYGFNKSHSAAYALISYHTAYFKSKYTLEYMAALLSSVVSVSDRTALYIQECQRMGINVMPPDINESVTDFSIFFNTETNANYIRFGLGAVKNIGEGAIKSIIENRSSEDPYKSMSNFCSRVDLRQVNKRVLESLIKSGALDRLGERGQLLNTYENTLEKAQVIAREKSNGQESLFGCMQELAVSSFDEQAAVSSNNISRYEKLCMEKEMLGLYITGHPLEEFQDKLSRLKHHSGNIQEVDRMSKVFIAGLLEECRQVITRNKKEMIVAKLVDLKGSVPILLFSSDDFEIKKQLFKDDNIVYISGRVRPGRDEVTVVCEEIELLDKAKQNQRMYIDLKSIDDNAVFSTILDISKRFHGSTPLYFKIGDVTILADSKYWISIDELCLKQIENLVGSGQLWIS
ncbi:DNA polymerase III subunit alpha [Thermoproteota archaeon]